MDDSAEAFHRPPWLTSAVWVRDGGMERMRVMGHEHSDNLSAKPCWLPSPIRPHLRLYKGYTARLI